MITLLLHLFRLLPFLFGGHRQLAEHPSHRPLLALHLCRVTNNPAFPCRDGPNTYLHTSRSRQADDSWPQTSWKGRQGNRTRSWRRTALPSSSTFPDAPITSRGARTVPNALLPPHAGAAQRQRDAQAPAAPSRARLPSGARGPGVPLIGRGRFVDAVPLLEQALEGSRQAGIPFLEAVNAVSQSRSRLHHGRTGR
jgi:hypothetical protein